ncbi:MAG TPA: hypothetical protein VHK01_00545 [Lacipirellulaceae bacterium]|jgi:hypothetical protein|nr:hypothetical protein [Lacipirellulaceae bacterium]
MSKPTALASLILFLSCIGNAKADLFTHVLVSQLGSTFNYTVFNDEPAASTNHVNMFHLTVNAPITVTGIPAGWDFTTDNATFVGWFNTDIDPPYPDDIPPLGSMTFSITSSVTTTSLNRYTVAAWDHATDGPGPAYRDFIASPSIQAVPEPSGVLFFVVAIVIGLVGLKWTTVNKGHP